MYDLGCLMSDMKCQMSDFRWQVEGLKQDSTNVLPLMGANLRKNRVGAMTEMNGL
jgi:hypothetical protein